MHAALAATLAQDSTRHCTLLVHQAIALCCVLSVFAAQAAALSAELEACRAGIEQSGIDGARLAGMGDAELQEVAASVGGKRLREKLLQELKIAREVCEAQIATMRHFEE